MKQLNKFLRRLAKNRHSFEPFESPEHDVKAHKDFVLKHLVPYSDYHPFESWGFDPRRRIPSLILTNKGYFKVLYWKHTKQLSSMLSCSC
jgi:hypothetical protein